MKYTKKNKFLMNEIYKKKQVFKTNSFIFFYILIKCYDKYYFEQILVLYFAPGWIDPGADASVPVDPRLHQMPDHLQEDLHQVLRGREAGRAEAEVLPVYDRTEFTWSGLSGNM